jgi:hypothetical protein
MPTIVDDMRSAGFDDATIGSWANEQRPAMKQAGFDDATIEGYFSGLKDPASIPRPFMGRFKSWMDSSSISDAATEGAKAGFGEAPLGPTPEDNAKLRANGMYDDGTGNAAVRGLRMANEMVIPAASTAVEGMFRGLNGALSAGGAVTGQLVSEATGGNATDQAKARRDWAQMVTIGAMLAGTVSPVTRGPKPGGLVDETIGHLPQAEDFTAATKIAAEQHRQQTVLSIRGTDYSGVMHDAPDVPQPESSLGEPPAVPVDAVPALARQKIVQLYEDHGIHPAEISADVKNDPEIARSIMSDDPADLPKKYIQGYHGSPHDFEEFDSSKIGTGEGAQAYGHGIYIAEREGVGQSYRDALSRDKDRILENGGRLPTWVASTMESRNPIAIDDVRKTFQGRIAEAEAEAKTSSQPWLYPGKIQGLKDVLQSIEDHASGVPLKPAGVLYQVAINADKEHFLDWDKPLREQSDHVKAALKTLGYDPEAYTLPDGSLAPRLGGPKGIDVIKGDMGKNPAETSKALADAGIPGIKYLDGGSRSAGDGTNNFVVFNDKHLEITHKNGEPVSKQIRDEQLAAAAPHNDHGRWVSSASGDHDKDYPRAKNDVDGLTVLDDVPNRSSIESSLTDYTALHGIREVSMSSFENSGLPRFYSVTEETRTKQLAADIKESGEIKPLIVVVEENNLKAGPYILEGGHRFDALKLLGKKSFPAEVVVDDQLAAATPEPAKPDIFSQAADRAAGQDLLDGPEGGKAHGLGADASDPYTDNPKTLLPPGKLVDALRSAASKVTDIWHNIQMNTVPMALGGNAERAVSKDFASVLRRVRYEWSRKDDAIVKQFNAEDRARMWSASDEESVALQLGESREHQGLVTLTKEQRDVVEALQTEAQATFVQARDLGMVEGEGLPSYTPRMLINIATGDGKGTRALNAIGTNLKTTSARLKHRAHMMDYETEAAAKAKFGNDVELARDIRALPLATADLQTAIAGRQFIENIKEIGERAGTDTVSEGVKPTEGKWFTIDHPAFRTWKPKLKEVDGKWEAVKDTEGNVIFEQTPIYVHGDFEGPLRAVLDEKSGEFYKAAMELKGKTMSVIMNSFMIHNAVEFGRAFATMPIKMITLRVYRDGAKAIADLPTMREAIDHGMVPIGHRGFNQDITSIMEAPDLKAGRSTTANVLANTIGNIPQKGLDVAEVKMGIKEDIDKAGNFWHNTMLWDQIAKLQAGLYINFRDAEIAKGTDPITAQYAAAHQANRYAGALPKEAMSDGATKIANSIFFSRSFTMGNLGVMKDMLTGLPRDVMAQIERDVGSVDPNAVGRARSMAQRKAISVVVTDIVLFYVGNSLLQSAINVISGRKDAADEAQGYPDRLKAAFQHAQENPTDILHPFALAQSLTPMSENEPGKQDRVFVGYAKDGTAVYMRNPVGKIGEEFQSWFNSPLEMLRKKEGTIFRPLMQIFANDKGFRRQVYDPYAESYWDLVKNVVAIAEHIAKAQTPEGQIRAGVDLATGQGDQNVNAAQAFGPLLGTTFSKGAPGGPAMGELYSQKSREEYAINAKLPDWRRQIQNGDAMGAVSEMTQMGVPKWLTQVYVRTSLVPGSRMTGKSMMDFYLSATPEQRNRMEDTLKRQQASQ